MKKNLTLILFLLYISCGKDAPVETPTPQIIKYTLSFSAGSGGSVSIPGGSYETGTSVSVTATPDSEYVFVDWSNGSTQNPLSVSVNSNLTLTANFEKRKYPLTMNIVGEGTVSEEIISAGRTTTEYNSGSVIRLTANPSDEWVFTGWSGSVSSTTNPIELTVDESKTISVTFIKRQYPLTINIQGEGTVSEEIISAGKTTEYNSGSVVRLTAQPLEGNFPGAPVHVFSGWTGDYEGTENPIELNITQAMSLTAIFAIVQVVTVGDNKLFIDKSGIPDGDNYKLITEIIPSTGEIKLYFHNIIDRNGVWGNISLWENKLIKWRGTNDSLKNPILVQPNNQIIKPVIGNLYDYLENEYDMPFIYSWDQQMEHTQNKPMGWEGKFLDYEGDGDPDIFGLRNNNNGGKDFVVVGYDRSTRNYFLKKELRFILKSEH